MIVFVVLFWKVGLTYQNLKVFASNECHNLSMKFIMRSDEIKLVALY